MSSTARGSEVGSGSSGLPTLPKKKAAWSRRSWSTQEEECLLVALKDIVAQGWKSDNGFKAGYQNKLEAAIKEKFPSTDLKGSPHINSKISQWKKNYGLIQDILANSGVGFNSDFVIDCTSDQWDQLIKKDSNARGLRYKPWPYYNDWCECFGKDRATGDIAEDFMDATQAFNNQANDADMPTASHDNNTTEEENENEEQGDSVSQPGKMNSTAKAKAKRRVPGGEIEMVVEALGEIGKKADARLCEMVKRMGFEFDVKKTKQEAFRLLDFIPGLSIRQKFVVCQILAKELDKLDVFMGLSDEERPAYVLFLLE